MAASRGYKDIFLELLNRGATTTVERKGVGRIPAVIDQLMEGYSWELRGDYDEMLRGLLKRGHRYPVDHMIECSLDKSLDYALSVNMSFPDRLVENLIVCDNVPVIEVFLKHNRCSDNDFLHAIRLQRQRIVCMFLKHHSFTTDGVDFLRLAVDHNLTEIACTLLNCGLFIYDQYALLKLVCIAVEHDNRGIVSALLQSRIPLNKEVPSWGIPVSVNWGIQTPLVCAINYGSGDVVDILLDHGATLDDSVSVNIGPGCYYYWYAKHRDRKAMHYRIVKQGWVKRYPMLKLKQMLRLVIECRVKLKPRIPDNTPADDTELLNLLWNMIGCPFDLQKHICDVALDMIMKVHSKAVANYLCQSDTPGYFDD